VDSRLKLLYSKWHRTAIAQDGDIDAQMAAVNNHLAQMGEQPVSAEDIAKIKSHHSLFKTSH